MQQRLERVHGAFSALLTLAGADTASAAQTLTHSIPARVRRAPGTPSLALGFQVERFDDEAFGSDAMARARLPSVLVKLFVPPGGQGLMPGVYAARLGAHGALLCVCGQGRGPQTAAELCVLDWPSLELRQPEMLCPGGGKLADVRYLRPLHHGLARFDSSGRPLRAQVEVDVLAAAELLQGCQTSPQPPPPSATTKSTPAPIAAAVQPPPRFSVELLVYQLMPFLGLLDLPSWAAASALLHSAARDHVGAAFAAELRVFGPGDRAGGALPAGLRPIEAAAVA